MVATIREISPLITGKEEVYVCVWGRGGIGRQQSTIWSHNIAANLITEDQNTQMPGLTVNENFSLHKQEKMLWN